MTLAVAPWQFHEYASSFHFFLSKIATFLSSTKQKNFSKLFSTMHSNLQCVLSNGSEKN